MVFLWFGDDLHEESEVISALGNLTSILPTSNRGEIRARGERITSVAAVTVSSYSVSSDR